MLLNRKRVKFWQKIIFGFMAALMAGFLIFGYSGVASSCNGAKTINSGNSAIDKQVKAAVATLAKNPTDAAALLSAAQGYQASGMPESASGQAAAAPTASQTADLTRALTYYDRYIKLPDAKLGAAAAGERFNALKNEAIIYNALIDYKGAIGVVKKMLKLQPKDYDLYLTIASNQIQGGDTAGAIATYNTYLKLDPHSQYATSVRTALAGLQGSASPSPSATP
ncbi:MAG TPA: tetratricopeptide repeat protein [Thermoleophilia bacterium]|nr:tetratricopeptide repeat protein [Thermoleophilia bacterium]